MRLQCWKKGEKIGPAAGNGFEEENQGLSCALCFVWQKSGGRMSGRLICAVKEKGERRPVGFFGGEGCGYSLGKMGKREQTPLLRGVL